VISERLLFDVSKLSEQGTFFLGECFDELFEVLAALSPSLEKRVGSTHKSGKFCDDRICAFPDQQNKNIKSITLFYAVYLVVKLVAALENRVKHFVTA
jgi:hypothetical protein